jgi:hypothetical protein
LTDATGRSDQILNTLETIAPILVLPEEEDPVVDAEFFAHVDTESVVRQLAVGSASNQQRVGLELASIVRFVCDGVRRVVGGGVLVARRDGQAAAEIELPGISLRRWCLSLNRSGNGKHTQQ